MNAKNAISAALLLFVAVSLAWLVFGPPGKDSAAAEPPIRDGVIVYYFHRTERCPTCETIEACTEEAVTGGFREQLEQERLQWQMVNYESKDNRHFKAKYRLEMPLVVLVEVKDGEEQDSRKLPRVMELASDGDRRGLVDYIQRETRAFLSSREASDESEGDRHASETRPPTDSSSESIEVDESDGEAPVPLD